MTDSLPSNHLLRCVIEDADLKFRAVGDICGYDISSVSRFCNGERHAPFEVWRRLFAKTKDLRIPQFIHGQTGYASVNVVPPRGFRDDRDALKALAAEMREHCQAIQSAADLVCDGFGPEDRRKLPLFVKEADEAISALYALKQLFVARVREACDTRSHPQNATGKGRPR